MPWWGWLLLGVALGGLAVAAYFFWHLKDMWKY
jgi:hypothetical protein